MKVGDTRQVSGVILRAVKSTNLCDGCHLYPGDMGNSLTSICGVTSCVGVIYKVVGLAELDPWHNGAKDETQNFSGKCTFSFSATIGPGDEIRKVEDVCLISYKNVTSTIVDLSEFTDDDGNTIADFLRDEQYDFTKEVVKQTKTNI